MTVRVDWDDPDHSVLLYTLECHWTWEEMYEAVEKSITMINTVSHKICVIVDNQSSKGLPPGAIGQFGRITRFMTPQIELVIIAGGGTLLLSLFNLFILLVGSNAPKYCWVSDLDKAYSTLAERRAASMT